MIWWCIAAFAAFFVKGICGFASTLVFSTIQSFRVDNINITPVELILSFPANFLIVWKERKKISARICLPLIGLVLVGMIPGVLFLTKANAHIVKIVFGFAIVLLGIEMYVRNSRKSKLKNSKATIGILGIISGMLTGSYGISALMTACVSRMTDDVDAFKGNLCAIFIVDNFTRLFVYIYWGVMTFDTIYLSIILLPIMVAGLGTGMIVGKILDEKIVKKLVILMLMLSGVALVATNI